MQASNSKADPVRRPAAQGRAVPVSKKQLTVSVCSPPNAKRPQRGLRGPPCVDAFTNQERPLALTEERCDEPEQWNNCNV